MSWLRHVVLIVRKDVHIERRTCEITATTAFFSALMAVTASVALQSGPELRTRVAPVVIWVVTAFSSVLAVSKTWQREREEGVLDGLLVSPIHRSALFAGKAVSLVAFLVVVEAVTIPVVAILFSIEVFAVGPGMLLITLFALPGICATGTLFGAMTVRTNARELVFACVFLPLLLPTLLAAVAATRELFSGAQFESLQDYLLIMLVFDVTFSAGGLVLFGSLIDS